MIEITCAFYEHRSLNADLFPEAVFLIETWHGGATYRSNSTVYPAIL